MPAVDRRALPAPVDDPLDDLRNLIAQMEPGELAYWYETSDRATRQLIDRMMAEDANEGIRAHPARFAATLKDVVPGGTYQVWAYVELLSRRFADLIFRRRPRQLWKLPSQYGKTSMCSRVGPIWALDLNPRLRIMYVSYDADKAVEEAGNTRDLIDANSAALRFRLRPDRRARGMWKTDEGGGFYATGIGGAITGFPADVVIGDDMIKGWMAAHSETERDRAWNVYRSQMRMRIQRVDDPILLAGTCWHEDDVLARASKLDELDRFENVRLPAIAEAPSKEYPEPDLLGRAPGEVLEPLRFPPEEVRARARVLGSYLAAAMEQQRPAPEEGLDIKRAWFKLDSPPPARFDQVATSWDMKLKDNEQGDYVVGLTVGRVGGDYWVLSMLRGQWDQATTRAAMALSLVRDRRVTAHYYENTGYGPEVAAQLRKAVPGYVVSDEIAGAIGATIDERAGIEDIVRHGVSALISVNPKGPKPVRARAVAPIAEAGNVHLNPAMVGVDVFLTEVSSFPNGAHDDIVDAWSQALSRMSRGLASAETMADRPDLRIERPSANSIVAALRRR
jgi:hypothetical protein